MDRAIRDVEITRAFLNEESLTHVAKRMGINIGVATNAVHRTLRQLDKSKYDSFVRAIGNGDNAAPRRGQILPEKEYWLSLLDNEIEVPANVDDLINDFANEQRANLEGFLRKLKIMTA